MTLIAFLESILTVVILISIYWTARRTWPYDIKDFIILLIGIVFLLLYDYMTAFNYQFLFSVVILMIVFWFRNPLLIVKGLLIWGSITLTANILNYSLLFHLWLSRPQLSAFVLLSSTALLLILELIFKPISTFFEKHPIMATQSSAMLIPASVIIQLFFNNLIMASEITLHIVVVLLGFLVTGYALLQAQTLNKCAIRHSMLYTALFDDFSTMVETEHTSRQEIIQRISVAHDDKISPSLKLQIQHLLSKQAMESFSADPYINLVAYGLNKTYKNLHISIYGDFEKGNTPAFCTWLEMISELFMVHWECDYCSITTSPLSPGKLVLKIEGAKTPIKQLSQFIRPKYFHFLSIQPMQYWFCYLTVIYLNSKLKMQGRLFIDTQTQIIFERNT